MSGVAVPVLTIRSLSTNKMRTTVIFEATLSTSGNGGNFVSTLLTGYEMEPFMRNPLFESNTCAEFWNKRWNKLIQTLLSRGIYKPFRTILPRYIALTATFTVSGLFHEWLMSLIFAPLPEDLNEYGSCEPPKCFRLTHGSAVVFFVWVALVITLEFMFTPKKYFRNPYIWYKVASSSLTALACIFFLDPYVHTRFFNEGYVGYFMVHPVGQYV
jgi:Membrane bound O-acyl transferase family